MKRSDAVELIAKRLNPVGISTPTCEEVLEILEEAGMLPPPRTFWDKNVHENYNPVTRNEWEPENG